MDIIIWSNVWICTQCNGIILSQISYGQIVLKILLPSGFQIATIRGSDDQNMKMGGKKGQLFNVGENHVGALHQNLRYAMDVKICIF